MPTREALLNSLTELRRAHIRGQRAPYKPLTLLSAIGRMWSNFESPRLIAFTQARDAITPLFEEFGRGSDRLVNPINPLWRLQTDGNGDLWECAVSRPPVLRADGIPSADELKQLGARFGLTAEAHQLLLEDIPLRLQAGQLLASQVCPPELWPDLFEATGIPFDGTTSPVSIQLTHDRTRQMAIRVSRSARFRTDVLKAYGHRCAICGVSPKVADKRFAIEAAHVQWVTEDGPDEVQNGIALCVMHHRGLDRGAFTFTPTGCVEISRRLERMDDGTADQFWKFDGSEVLPPYLPSEAILPVYIEWHRREVFVGS
jgi:putative restriction endonuclease